MLEQKPSSEQKVETQDSSSPNSTNALVVGSPSLSNEKGLAAHMICHPERPYSEYVLVSPEDYVEGFTYSEYLKSHTPIVVEEAETF